MRKSSWMLVIMLTAAVFAANGNAFAGPNTSLPFFDTFESNTFGFYTNGTPLINGTNGWYGSSGGIMVQTNIARTGTNAAIIPYDCVLSNRFQNITPTNVWIQMDVRPDLYDVTNKPVVDTNKAVMFYINTSGYFVVHHGPPDNPTNSTKWVMTTNGSIGTSGTNWVSLQIRMNYAAHTWDLYTTNNNRIRVTNNIGFINTSLTNFAGFSAYNGSQTTYMDSVSVEMPPTTNYFLSVTPAGVTNSVMWGYTTTNTLTVTNRGSTSMTWTARIVDTWIQMAVTNGTVEAGGSTNLVVISSAATPAAGTYAGSVTVSATIADDWFSSEHVVVPFVLKVMDLQRAPDQLTNAVMQGESTSNSFAVRNAGPGVFNYYVTTTTNPSWMRLSQTNGILTGQTANATNTIWVTYTNTTGLPLGANYGAITISAAGGGGVTLDVILTVRAVPMLKVSTALITNTVMEGQNLASQVLRVWNESAYYPIGYRVTTNGGGTWLSVLVTNNYLAPLATNTLTISNAVSPLRLAGDVPSNYTGTITIWATNIVSGSLAGGSPAEVSVSVIVNPKPRLALSLTNLSPTVLQGQDAAGQEFDVWNANGFTEYRLDYTIATTNTRNSNERIAWLVLTPAETSGSSTGQLKTITVQYSTANLPAGITNAIIKVVGRACDGVNYDSALNATQEIVVTLSVAPFATLTNNALSEYAYPNVRKGALPPVTVFSNWNAGNPAGAMYFTVSPSVDWLTVTPASGTSTGTSDKVKVSVQADPAGMKPGVVYRGTVTINATDAGSGKPAYRSPQAFTIAVVIRNFKGFDFQGELSPSGASDLVLYREANGAWEIRNLLSNYATTQYLGGAGYQAVPGDYYGDGVTCMGAYRPASGSWYAQQAGAESAQGLELQQWAGEEYVGVPGDYDGDGQTDMGVYLEKSGLWRLLLSSKGYQPDQEVSGIFGGPGYTALLAGDYDGDCIIDPGVYHRTSGLWAVLFSTSQSVISGTFGGTGFVPVPTDYDGDGLTDPAVYATESGYWYILTSTTLTSQGYSLLTRQFGGVALSATLVPVPGNYDGAGGADLGLYDTTTWRWYIITFNRDTTLDGVPLAWGYPMGRLGCLPVLP